MYARDAVKFQRAFFVLQKDFLGLLDFIEPSEQNLRCYSYRTLELLMRVCIEIEANLKAILVENRYSRDAKDLTMADYCNVDRSHRLSSFQAKLPVWTGSENVRQPFAPWAKNAHLPWYQAYNSAKHDRHTNFADANFGAVVNAMCGLAILMSAQFMDEDFAPESYLELSGGAPGGFEPAIGKYFLTKYPTDWPVEDRYVFDWRAIREESNPFDSFPYAIDASQSATDPKRRRCRAFLVKRTNLGRVSGA
jgi:hypothetical protein